MINGIKTMASESNQRSSPAALWRRLFWPLPRTMLLAGLVAVFYGPSWSAYTDLQTTGQYLTLFLALSSLMDLESRLADREAGNTNCSVSKHAE